MYIYADRCGFSGTYRGLACDPEKISAIRNWHAPDKIKAVHQFVCFVGYYRCFVKDIVGLAEPLVALTRKGVPFVWTDRQQTAFEALKACLISSHTGFSNRGRTVPVGYGCQSLCGGGSSEPTTGGSGGGDRPCQLKSSPFSAAVLYDTPGDAGGSCYVHTFSVISYGWSVHSAYESQLSSVAAEVPKW